MPRQHSLNNFDAIRLLAAGMVLCSHEFALTGRVEPHPFGLVKLGTLGVLVFFSVSGYLVAQSWANDPHPLRFAARRMLRVWPGLAAVTCVAAWLVGPLVSTWSLRDYFLSQETWSYFSQLYFVVQPHLPGVFEHSPFPVVNGSLWTIPIELRWYGVLLLAGICGLLRQRVRYLLLVLVLCYAAYVFLLYDVQHNPRASFLGPDFGYEYGAFFCYGAVLFHFRDAWQRHPWRLLAGLALLAAALEACQHGYASLFVLLPFAVIRAGEWSTPVLRRLGRYGDFSYGIYIYAFMVQKSLVQWLGPDHLYGLMLLSGACSLACAAFSWHLVERPMLNLKRHLPGAAPLMGDTARTQVPSMEAVSLGQGHGDIVAWRDEGQ
jgi:peptidoglycan/LPS O-acetylase OafA/YrhL